MPSKKALLVEDDEPRTPRKPETGLVRVEESVEDFLTLMLPTVTGTKMQVCPLYSDKKGSSFFRIKYWKYITDGFMVTRKEQESRFVRVDKYGHDRTMVDLTIVRPSIR